ncbi:hypothetical protein I547_1797 [Mycobacterium kansasii 824]|nr:hypothetical protein I547_1797 [Mycobacterium kansasii 824]
MRLGNRSGPGGGPAAGGGPGRCASALAAAKCSVGWVAWPAPGPA